MSDSNKAFYVTSVSNGLVLANQPNGKPSGVVASNCGDKGDDEKWMIEAGDKPNVVALRNASNGKYLRAEGDRSGSKAGTGEKQWWTISSDRVLAPGACSLSPVDYPNVYLNHFQGRAVPKGHVGMTVHMWKWEAAYPQWFTWYMFDANASFNPLTSGTNAGDSNKVDFDSKLKALEERDNALSEKDQTRSKEWDDKMRDLKDREATSTKEQEERTANIDQKLKALEERDNVLAEKDQTRSKEWDDKMKNLQDRETTSLKEEEERTANFDKKLKDLQDREAALSRKEKESTSSNSNPSDGSKSNDNDAQAQGEADIQRKLDHLSSAEQKLAADRAALQKSQSDIANKEKDIAQREKDIENSQASEASKPSTNGNTAPDNTAEKKLAADRAALEKSQSELAKREKDIAQREKDFENSQTSRVSKPSTNGDAVPDKTPEQRLEKTQKDNAGLEQRLARLEDQLANMAKSSEKASNGVSKPKANAKTATVTPSKVDASSPGCGYKHYKPPRKLNRKLIGMVYE